MVDTENMQSRPIRRGIGASVVAALLSLLLPGLGHWFIRARLNGRVVGAAIANLIASVTLVDVASSVHSRSELADLVANRPVLYAIAFALATLALTHGWAAVDAAWQSRPEHNRAVRAATSFGVITAVAICVLPLVVAANYVIQTDRAVDHVFSSHEAVTAYPGTQPSQTTPATSTTTGATDSTIAGATTTTPVPESTMPPIVGANRVNILLLGGDAGPGRYSLRTDSMVVVSIDPTNGDTAMISVPRNLQHLPFPPGTALAEKYPKGFTDLANAVYTFANGHKDIMGGIDDAGAQAIKLGIAQLLGMPINYYVLVDMAGFVNVVDALGGIDINVTARVPSPGNPRGAKHDVPAFIERGQQHMDGTIALAYSRTREADSDYRRMGRQRCVLAAIANAATPMALATGLAELITAFGDAVRTDIPRDRLGEFASLLDRFTGAGGLSTVRTLLLTPPLIEPSRWNAAEIRQLVVNVIAPGSLVPPPPPSTTPVPTTIGAPTSTVAPPPSTAPPATTPPPTTAPPDVLTSDC